MFEVGEFVVGDAELDWVVGVAEVVAEGEEELLEADADAEAL